MRLADFDGDGELEIAVGTAGLSHTHWVHLQKIHQDRIAYSTTVCTQGLIPSYEKILYRRFWYAVDACCAVCLRFVVSQA